MGGGRCKAWTMLTEQSQDHSLLWLSLTWAGQSGIISDITELTVTLFGTVSWWAMISSDSDLSQSVMDNVILGPRETGRLTNDHYFDVSLNSQDNKTTLSISSAPPVWSTVKNLMWTEFRNESDVHYVHSSSNMYIQWFMRSNFISSGQSPPPPHTDLGSKFGEIQPIFRKYSWLDMFAKCY